MAITFREVSSVILTPGAFSEVDNSGAVRGTPRRPWKALLVGQKLTGSATAGQPYLVEKGNETDLFGYNSILASMVRHWKKIMPGAELFAIGLADAAGTKAAGDWTITGTATKAGELVFYFAGRRLAVPVAVGDTAAAVATAALALLQAVADSPLVFTSGGSGVITATAQHFGTQGNQIKLGTVLHDGEAVPAGLAVAVTQPTGGATDPDFTTAVTGMGEDQYNTIALGISSKTEIDKFTAELESRWGGMRDIYGALFTCATGTQGSLTTLGNSYNTWVHTLIGIPVSGLVFAPHELATRVAASNHAQTERDPALSQQGHSLGADCYAPHRAVRFTRAQRDILLSDGVSTLKPASDGRYVIERLVTTYQTNGSGIPDPSYQDLTSVRTLDYLRYSWKARMLLRFGNVKLAKESASGYVYPTGANVVTPSGIRSECIALAYDWRDAGLIEDVETFVANMLVEINGSDPNRCDMLLPVDVINNLLVSAARIAYVR